MLFGRGKKNPIKITDKKIKEWKYATCGYCSTGCSIEVGLNEAGKPVSSRGVGGADVNRGKLCLKGIFEHELFDSAGRGTEPKIRDSFLDDWKTTSWESALDHCHDEIRRVQEKYGRDSVAIISTGQMLTEEFYTLGKLTRGLIGTNNYDGNTTLCMASAVSGYKRSFGSDGPPGCYDDFEHTDVLIAWGSNLPEQHPIIYWRMKEAQEKKGFPLIVIDPRVTMLAQNADRHLTITPGTDVVLMNAMMHVIFDEGLEDKRYIKANTNGVDALKAEVAKYDPVTAAKICGIDEDTIRVVARLFANAGAAMQIWTMGINQSTHGSDGVVGINNLALITGNIGIKGGTSLSITGQCNAMGTREWSSCSGLPNHRYLENEQDRIDIGKFWNVDPDFFPKKRGMVQTDIYAAIETGQIKGLWLIATNPMTSLPNTARIRRAMESLEFCAVQDCYEDTDICFGCGYCTWVCPYNAPQLDPVAGVVSKCNMCVDHLEVGLKPACVSACLGKALEFGVIENTPEGRSQVDAEIPSFPDTSITNPNIRFQQTKTLNRDMKRVDSTAIKYHLDDKAGKYQPVLDEKHGREKHWGIKTLLASHENAHVMFTLSAQAVMGAFVMLTVLGSLFGAPAIQGLQQSSARMPLLLIMFSLMGIGLFKLNMHLGKPHRFYRGFNNLRHSPLSREIAGVTAFFAGLAGYTFFSFFDNGLTHFLAGASAILGLIGFIAGSYYMYKLYRIKARPFWDHWQTASTFYGSMLSLGGLLVGFVASIFMENSFVLIQTLAALIAFGLILEAVGLIFHARDLKKGTGEGQAAYYELSTSFGKSYRLRNALLAINILLFIIVSSTSLSGILGLLTGYFLLFH